MQNLKDIREAVNQNPKKYLNLFLSQPKSSQAAILSKISRYSKNYIVDHISDQDLVDVLNYLDPDIGTDILQLASKTRQKKILSSLNKELKSVIDMLILFPPDVAAGLMKINYIIVDSEETMEDVSKKIRNHEEKTGKLPEIIISKEGKFIGYLPIHKLGLSMPSEKVGNQYKKALKINSLAKGEEIIKLFKNNPHKKVVVMGNEGNVLGIIYSDDVLQLIDSSNESLYSLAGVNNEETVLDDYQSKVKFRYKWLIINLGTSFIAAFSVSLFQDTIAKYVLLAVYMPIIAGMGGNSATQTLAVLVRGLSQGQVTSKNLFYIIKNEVFASFLNGLINGLIVATIVLIFNRDVQFAIVISVAMIMNLIVAGFFGAFIPYIMTKLGKDPASSATIFITTATDVLGFIFFLGFATLLLG